MINQVTFGDIRDLWHRILVSNSIHAPFLTWEWHNEWYKIFRGDYEEYTLLLNGSVIIPFIRLGHTAQFSGGDEIADYLDIIGSDDKKQYAWNEIIPFLKERGITEIQLRNVPANSPTLDMVRQYGADVAEEDTTPVFTLPDTWNAYTESLSKKHRHELERKMRKFGREHIDAVVIDSVSPAEDIAILFTLMEKDVEKKRFLTPLMKQFFTAICRIFSGNVNLKYITLGDKPISAILAFRMYDTYYLYNSGFDKDCCNIAGFYLKAISIRHAIDQGITTYNFLQGNERYKYELGAKDFFVHSAHIQL